MRGEILEVLEMPFKYPDLFFPGCPRRQGVLLYGPPGKRSTVWDVIRCCLALCVDLYGFLCVFWTYTAIGGLKYMFSYILISHLCV